MTDISHPDLAAIPRARFERADDLLTRAADLRDQAWFLQRRSTKLLEKAQRSEEDAKRLQKMAEDDRGYIQAELDILLQYHRAILDEYVAADLRNAARLERVMQAVEDGDASVHEIADLGERLMSFRDTAVLEAADGSEWPGVEDELSIGDSLMDGGTALATSSPAREGRISTVAFEARQSDSTDEAPEFEMTTTLSNRRTGKKKRRRKKRANRPVEYAPEGLFIHTLTAS